MRGDLTNAEMDALLGTERIGHLGCLDGNRPYVVPMAFVFHDDVLYGQTTEGKKVEMLRKNPTVCFQVEALKEKQWKSAMLYGTFEELDFENLPPGAIPAIKLLTERIGTIQDDIGVKIPYAYSVNAILPLKVNEKTSTLFRIVVTEKSGKFYRAKE